MFTTGNKFLLGATVLSIVAAVLYGVTQDGARGTVGLVSAAVALGFLTVINMIARDSNVFVDAAARAEATAAAQRPPGASVWPFALAFGGVTIAVGLVSYQPIVVIGLVAILASGVEWLFQAWAERASADRAHNSQVRSRIANPLEVPVFAAVGVGIVVYAFSRIMLWLSKTNTVIAFAVVAAVVLVLAFLFAYRPSVKTGAIGGVIVVGALAIVAGGAAAGVDGQREIHEFETTAIYQAEAVEHGEGEAPICESPEEFAEADEDVSQTVAMKSGAIEVFLRDDGTLDFNVPGPMDDNEELVIPRGNSTNFIFRNEHDGKARLSLDLGTETVPNEESGEDEERPIQMCTTLIEEGAAQILTLTVGVPSLAFEGVENANGPGLPEGDGYWFFVPGIDSAKLELVVR